MKYYQLIERNDYEGETWKFYIPEEGNEEALSLLQEVEGDFEVHSKLLDENIVDVLVEYANDDVGYMFPHNKLEGTINKTKLEDAEDVHQLLYKGGIKNLME